MEDYVNSEFNDGNFNIHNSDIFYNNEYITIDGSYIEATSKIIHNQTYISYEHCCFDAGSKVLMADGTLKNIEDVKVGDMVMSLDEKTGEYTAQRVYATIIKEKSDDLVYVHLSNGTKIGMRAYHPLLTTEGWKSLRPEQAETIMDVGTVSMLEIGDTLIGYEENVTIVAIESREHIENYNTYNLSIENTRNYIVEGIVVHNGILCN